MNTKKLLIAVGSVVAVAVLVIVSLAGAIAGFVFYSIGNSEAAETARDFLRSNERLRRETGEVRDFGSLVTGSVNTNEAGGAATLHLKVIGERRTVNASVDLIYKAGYNWRAVGASYRNDAGKTVELLDSYGTASTSDEVGTDNEDEGAAADDGHNTADDESGEKPAREEGR